VKNLDLNEGINPWCLIFLKKCSGVFAGRKLLKKSLTAEKMQNISISPFI